MKARLGQRATGLPRALASEGAFGPHPHTFLTAAGLELLAFVDAELGIEVVEHDLTVATTFAHIAAPDRGAVSAEFLSRAGFPSHALVIRPNALGAEGPIFKGVADDATLADAIARWRPGLRRRPGGDRDRHAGRSQPHAHASHRPARQAARRAPHPALPGLWDARLSAVAAERGLPCAARAAPTDWVAVLVDGCARCARRRPRPRDDGLRATDPAHCARCNP
jgi:hypothetical protein